MTRQRYLLLIILIGIGITCVWSTIAVGKYMLDDFMFYNFMDHKKALTWNYGKALKWYSKAAEQGDSHAQRMLGDIMCDFGNYNEALKWYREAAEQGNRYAQCSLAAMYCYCDSVPQDYVQAYKWAALSTEDDYPPDIKFMDSLKEKMTPEQIAEAQRLVEEFTPKTENKTTLKAVVYDLILQSL